MRTLQKTQTLQPEMPGVWNVDRFKPTSLEVPYQDGHLEAEVGRLEALTRERAREIATKYRLRRM